MGIEEVSTAHRLLWQNPFADRLVGSIRREFLNHLIEINEAQPPCTLTNYFAYYHENGTHLSLDRNAPISRNAEPPNHGCVIAIPRVGAPHHRCARAA
jgi:hypothetical protein